MELKLAKGENIVKDWDYALTKSGRLPVKRVQTKTNLTVTNKRIVSTVTKKNGAARDEIMVKDVKSISSSYAFSKLNLVALVIGLAWIVTGLIMMTLINSAPAKSTMKGLTFIPIILLVAGALFLLFFIKSLFRKASLTLTIFGKANVPVMSVHANSMKLGKKKAAKRIKIKVSKDCAADIVETIGATIVENQE